MTDEYESGLPLEIPIDGILDLHTFRPADIKDLLPEYLEACRSRDILQARIIHGKGTGALRETVHSILTRLPYVESFGLCDETAGGWGATAVKLRMHPDRNIPSCGKEG